MEIFYFYEVYPNNDDFIIDKNNIIWKPQPKPDNNPDLYQVYPKNDDFIIDKNNIIWKPQPKPDNNPDLYQVYPKNDDFTIEKTDVCPVDKMSNRTYRIFLETEYLENLYEEINIFISANKATTIEAMIPKNETNLPKLTCVFPIHYPLVPPFVYMNDVLYMNIIHCCHLERVKFIVAKYSMSYRKYINCISCGSVLKNGNWNQKTMFSDVFTEWEKIQEMKIIVGYELALDDLILYRDLDYYNFIHIMEYLVEP